MREEKLQGEMRRLEERREWEKEERYSQSGVAVAHGTTYTCYEAIYLLSSSTDARLQVEISAAPPRAHTPFFYTTDLFCYPLSRSLHSTRARGRNSSFSEFRTNGGSVGPLRIIYRV